MIVWILVYHLGYREGFLIDDFKSKQSCEAAILKLKQDKNSSIDDNYYPPTCIEIKK